MPERVDPYVYPGTTILRNRKGHRTPEKLARFEGVATTRRIAELEHRPVQGALDAAHLRAIHPHIFQDVFDWAGEFRTVDIARGGQFYFAYVHGIQPSLDELFGKLKAERFLKDADEATFLKRLAFYFGELNAVHPFREGNGRTQREFIREVALQSNHRLHWRSVTREAVYAASHLSFQRADYSGLESVLKAALAKVDLAN